jgi:predicted MFS family arabinose efflux permease
MDMRFLLISQMAIKHAIVFGVAMKLVSPLLLPDRQSQAMAILNERKSRSAHAFPS